MSPTPHNVVIVVFERLNNVKRKLCHLWDSKKKIPLRSEDHKEQRKIEVVRMSSYDAMHLRISLFFDNVFVSCTGSSIFNDRQT